jgi:hypothetical protein
MEYAGPRGIPHSVFLGRVVGPGEPQWLDADRDKAIWWMIHQRQACPECGTRPDEWADDPDAYVPEPHHCRGCEVAAQGEDYLERHRKKYRRGTTMRLKRGGDVTAGQAVEPAHPSIAGADQGGLLG